MNKEEGGLAVLKMDYLVIREFNQYSKTDITIRVIRMVRMRTLLCVKFLSKSIEEKHINHQKQKKSNQEFGYITIQVF